MDSHTVRDPRVLAAGLVWALLSAVRVEVSRELDRGEEVSGGLPSQIPVKGQSIVLSQVPGGFLVSVRLGLDKPGLETLAECGYCLDPVSIGDFSESPDPSEFLLSVWEKSREGYYLRWFRDCGRGGRVD